jgi:hypothetical protein
MQHVKNPVRRGLVVAGVVAGALALAASACDGDKPRPEDPPDASEPAPDAGPTYMRATVAEVPATPGRDLDLLFVIDDSPSMLNKQLNFRANFPAFVTALASWPGGLPNLHIGVITSDMGTKGSGSPTPGPAIGQIGQGGCSGLGKAGNLQIFSAGSDLDPGASFLSDIAQPGGARLQNYTGDLATVFSKLANAGAGGCGFEQPLAAMTSCSQRVSPTGSAGSHSVSTCTVPTTLCRALSRR